MGLKRRDLRIEYCVGIRFRRTLVGLKLLGEGPQGNGVEVFQTYPCGVEARPPEKLMRVPPCFRRTLVGLKRTLKVFPADVLGFQTYPCGVEADSLTESES